MSRRGGNGNRLIGQQQQQNLVLQSQVVNSALSIGAAQNVAMMTQNGNAALAIAGHNSQTLMVMGAQANLSRLSF